MNLIATVLFFETDGRRIIIEPEKLQKMSDRQYNQVHGGREQRLCVTLAISLMVAACERTD